MRYSENVKSYLRDWVSKFLRGVEGTHIPKAVKEIELKKIGFLVVTVVLVSAILGTLLFYKLTKAGFPIENVLPREPLFYVHIADVKKVQNEFASSPLWQNVKGIDIEALLEKTGLSEEAQASIRRTKAQISFILSNHLAEKIFGKEIALALYPSPADALTVDTLVEVTPELIVATRISPQENVKERISRMFTMLQILPQAQEEVYKGYTVTSLTFLNMPPVAYTKIKDLLIIGMGKKGVYPCIDVFAHSRGTLSQDHKYVTTQAALFAERDVSGYVQVQGVFSYLKKMVESSFGKKNVSLVSNENLLKFYNQTKGFSTWGCSMAFGELFESKCVVMLNKDEFDSPLLNAYYFKPQKNRALRFIPKDILAYKWYNCFDGSSFLESFHQEQKQLRESLPGYKPSTSGMTKLEKMLSKEIESELIPLIDNEIGGVLKDINFTPFFPFPESVIFFETKDISRMQRFIDTLMEEKKITLLSETYKGILMHYMPIPFVLEFEPGYCMIDEYVLLSTSRQFLKHCIDAYNDDALSLRANSDFQSVNRGITEENNASSFVKPDILLGRIETLIEKMINLMSAAASLQEDYQKLAQQNIEDFHGDIERVESELTVLKEKQSAFREYQDARGEENIARHTEAKQELDRISVDIGEKEKHLALAQKRLQEQELEWEKSTQSTIDARNRLELVKLYIDSVVLPVLSGLKTHKAIGQRTVIRKNLIEIFFYSRIEK